MGSTKKDSDLKKGESLAAVVITDSFDGKFDILTEGKPKCLLTLANKEMLDYTLEFLQSSGVQDTYVYSSKFVVQIKQHLMKKQWVSSNAHEPQIKRNKMNVSVIANEDCQSFGDAMRDLDGKGLLRDHFVLTNADVISNVNLESIVQDHKKRCQEDKSTTMTLIYKHADPGYHCRTKDQEVLLVTESKSNRILHHVRSKADFHKGAKKKGIVSFPSELFQSNSSDALNIRFDLLDPGIAICSPSVPLQFADNFDCQSLDDFIRGSIEDDLEVRSLYACILGDSHQGDKCYATRVTDFLTYMSVSADVLNRWTYPLVPEAGRNTDGKKLYSVARHNVYKVSI